MNGFERRRGQTRENIHRAADELFRKFGIGKVSVNDIARKAGVSQVTIYNHFGSKDNLVRDWLTASTAEYFNRLRIASESNERYPEKLKNIISCMLASMEDYNSDLDTEIMSYPELKPAWDSAFDEEVKFFMELIKEGKKQGYIGRQITSETLKIYFEILFQGMLARPELHARLHNHPKLMRGLLSLMLFGFYGENH